MANSGRRHKEQTRELVELPRETASSSAEPGQLETGDNLGLNSEEMTNLTLYSPLPAVQPHTPPLWSEQVESEEEELLDYLTSKDVFSQDPEPEGRVELPAEEPVEQTMTQMGLVHNDLTIPKHPKPCKQRVKEKSPWPFHAAGKRRRGRASTVDPPEYRISPMKFYYLATIGQKARKLSIANLCCPDEWLGIHMIKFGPCHRTHIRRLSQRDLIMVQNMSALYRLVESRPIVAAAVGRLKEPVNVAIFKHRSGRFWCRCMSRVSDNEVCLFEPAWDMLAWLRGLGSPMPPKGQFGSFGQHMS